MRIIGCALIFRRQVDKVGFSDTHFVFVASCLGLARWIDYCLLKLFLGGSESYGK